MTRLFCALLAASLLVFAGCSSSSSGPSGTDDIDAEGTLVFVSDRDGDYELYSMDLDTRAVTQLTDNDVRDRYPSISSDGTTIAFTRGDGGPRDNVWTMSVGGGSEQMITDTVPDESVPVWNSDDTRLAFGTDRDENWEIYTMDPDGTDFERVTTFAEYDSDPNWSPDTRIVFESDHPLNQDIYIIDADGTGATNITNDPSKDGDPAWSPDGARIAFNSNRDGDNEIYTVRPDGTGLTRLTDNTYDEQDPEWSPDGNFIAFGSDRDGNYEIYIMRANGTSVTRITNNAGEDWWAAWGE